MCIATHLRLRRRVGFQTFSQRKAGIGVARHPGVGGIGDGRGRRRHAGHGIHSQHGRRGAGPSRVVGQRIHRLRVTDLNRDHPGEKKISSRVRINIKS